MRRRTEQLATGEWAVLARVEEVEVRAGRDLTETAGTGAGFGRAAADARAGDRGRFPPRGGVAGRAGGARARRALRAALPRSRPKGSRARSRCGGWRTPPPPCASSTPSCADIATRRVGTNSKHRGRRSASGALPLAGNRSFAWCRPRERQLRAWFGPRLPVRSRRWLVRGRFRGKQPRLKRLGRGVPHATFALLKRSAAPPPNGGWLTRQLDRDHSSSDRGTRSGRSTASRSTDDGLPIDGPDPARGDRTTPVTVVHGRGPAGFGGAHPPMRRSRPPMPA